MSTSPAERNRAMRGHAKTLLLLAAGVCGAVAVRAAGDHTVGFTAYARVDRPDAYRRMLIDNRTLASLRSGATITDGATILMESYRGAGEITSIYARVRKDGRWMYGSFEDGETIADLRPRPWCSGCHLSATARNGTFTRAMLEAFAATGRIQRTSCNRTGRTPCESRVYDPAGTADDAQGRPLHATHGAGISDR